MILHRTTICICLLSTTVATADPPPLQNLIRDAERGDARAQLSVALCYRDGTGVKQDHAEAMRWGHLSADQGDPAAMDFVGWMYFCGHGVP